MQSNLFNPFSHFGHKVELTPRTELSSYHLLINQSTLKILGLLFEFKMATGWQLCRFMLGQDKNSYIYKKLNLMWQTGLLDSFKVYTHAGRFGNPLYYMLTKQGLMALRDYAYLEPESLNKYPRTLKDLLSSGSFAHESQIVELASLESMNQSKDKGLSLTFQGELNSKGKDFINDKPIEAFSPDYTVIYTQGGKKHSIYTEYERTRKSHEAMLKKIYRYYYFFLYPNDRKEYTLRIIFQTPGMEQGFWLNLFLNKPSYLQMNIMTTNLSLINSHKGFPGAIYANQETVKLTKEPKARAHISQRVKLFDWL